MYPLRIAFEGYALIGLTLLIMASAILLFIVRQPQKDRGARLVCAFFACIALAGATMVLKNGIVYYGTLFAPWQDFWVIAAGSALVVYAYVVPDGANAREGLVPLSLLAAISLAAFAYCVFFSYQFLFDWSPALDVPDAFYLLMPLGTLLAVMVFLHRAVRLSRAAERAADPSLPGAPASWWQSLRQPRGRDALLVRNLALALSLGFLPGVGMLVNLPYPFNFLAQHLGAMLALAAVALVYLNSASVVASFVAKLVGIALVGLLVLVSAIGNYEYRQTATEYDRGVLSLAARTRAGLAAGDVPAASPPLAYVVAWNAARPDDARGYRVLFTQPGEPDPDLARFIDENARQPDQAVPTGPEANALLSRNDWRHLRRWRTYPPGSGAWDYGALRYTEGGTTYEIGMSVMHRLAVLSETTAAWMGMIAITCLLTLLVFPVFFRTMLVRPLGALLAGVRRVNAGALDTSVPIRYPDEIGQLTGAFNELTRTLKASYAELEQRVAARTRELAAFVDLSKLGSLDKPLDEQLDPLLARVREVARSDALCLHLLADDHSALTLVRQAGLADAVLAPLRSVGVPHAFAGRIRNIEEPLVTHDLARERGLPSALRLTPFRSYLGAPLSPGGRGHGWLGCYRRDGAGFGASEGELLAALARQLGVIIENHRLQRQTRQLAALEERQRLARDLHDSVTQLIYGLTLYSRAGKEAALDGDAPRLERNLDKLADTAQAALREMRSLLFELQPPALENIGLAQALEERLAIVERRVGIHVDARIDTALSIPHRLERELYHVALEALNNSLKHAAASELLVGLARNNGCAQLVVADNGVGFEPAATRGGLGLAGMRARLAEVGGTLELHAGSGRGVQITARVPLPDEEVPNPDE